METVDAAAVLAAWDQFVADQKQRVVGHPFEAQLEPLVGQTTLIASQSIINAIARYNQYQPYYEGDTGKADLGKAVTTTAQQQRDILAAMIGALLKVSRS